MIGKNYKTYKEKVLEIYDSYKNIRGNINDGNDLEFLQSRIDKLKKGKFTLAVAGEVKAGKSTFLNALLGEELLPTDVLQATSAVIEIFKSEKSWLKIVFADGSSKEITSSVKERLKEICNVKDEFREIPFTLINEYIGEHESLKFEDLDIEELEKKSRLKNLNDKKDLIEKYIEETPKSKVALSIQCGYPLKWEFEELRLVDSPGVNATGGVQEVSYNYITKADAIIFVHQIKPIESGSFYEFVSNVITDRDRENLFLVLTHSGQHDSEEVGRLVNEAKKMYGEYIEKNKIIAVDSLLSIIHSELVNKTPLQKIRQNKQKRKAIASFKEEAEDEGRELVDVLKDASGFEKMNKIIDNYSMRVPIRQLEDILYSIKKGYNEQEDIQKKNIELLKEKKKSPQNFAKKIDKNTSDLELFRKELSIGKERLYAKYRGVDALHYKELNSTYSKYLNVIHESDSLNSIQKTGKDAINSFQDVMDFFSSSITSDLEKIMKVIAEDFENRCNINVPKTDLKALETKAKKKSYRKVEIKTERPVDFWDWLTFGIGRLVREDKIGTGKYKKEYVEQLHIKNAKKELKESLGQTRRELNIKSKEIVENYLNDFKTSFNKAIDSRQQNFEELKEQNESNDVIIIKIKRLEKRIEKLPKELKSIDEIIYQISE